ncbi:MAG: DUF4330 domain-containing protein [Oscillospiraceae bacterium]
MLINKDGKFFGKISIIDVLVVLGILFIAAGLFVRFSGGGKAVIAPDEKIEYTLKVKGVREFTKEAIEEGGFITDATTKEEMGKVIKVESTPAKAELTLSDGKFVNVDVPEEFDMIITAEVDGKISDKGFYTKGNKFMAAGSSYTVNTKLATVGCFVESIKKK